MLGPSPSLELLCDKPDSVTRSEHVQVEQAKESHQSSNTEICLVRSSSIFNWTWETSANPPSNVFNYAMPHANHTSPPPCGVCSDFLLEPSGGPHGPSAGRAAWSARITTCVLSCAKATSPCKLPSRTKMRCEQQNNAEYCLWILLFRKTQISIYAKHRLGVNNRACMNVFMCPFLSVYLCVFHLRRNY